jgi:hypothetical protein
MIRSGQEIIGIFNSAAYQQAHGRDEYCACRNETYQMSYYQVISLCFVSSTKSSPSLGRFQWKGCGGRVLNYYSQAHEGSGFPLGVLVDVFSDTERLGDLGFT